VKTTQRQAARKDIHHQSWPPLTTNNNDMHIRKEWGEFMEEDEVPGKEDQRLR